MCLCWQRTEPAGERACESNKEQRLELFQTCANPCHRNSPAPGSILLAAQASDPPIQIGSVSAQLRLSWSHHKQPFLVPFQHGQSPEVATKGSAEGEIRRSTSGASYAPILRRIHKPTQPRPQVIIHLSQIPIYSIIITHQSPRSTHNLVPLRNVLRRRIFRPLAS
jgi:hypothetical protein